MNDMYPNHIFTLLMIGAMIYLFFGLIKFLILVLPPDAGELILIPFIFLTVLTIGSKFLIFGISGIVEAKNHPDVPGLLKSIFSAVIGIIILGFTFFLLLTIFLQNR